MEDRLGYILLIAAAVPLFLGWDMSRRGLNKVTAAADKATAAANAVAGAVANTQTVLAQATGNEAQQLAAQTEAATTASVDLKDVVGDVKEGLKELTGPLAPARVFLGLALLLILAALFAFGIVDFSVGDTPPSGG